MIPHSFDLLNWAWCHICVARLLWTPSSTLAPARTRPVSEERELSGVRLLMCLLSGGSTRSVCSQMIVEKSSLNRLHREKIDTIPEFRRSGCSAPVPGRQLSGTLSPSLSVSLTSSSTLPRWLKVLLQSVRVYVNLCIVLSEGLLQQLRNQEEGRVGACGQVQQINIGPTWFWLDFWGWNENPSPTSAYTWKYLLVHSNLLPIFGNSCILAEILVVEQCGQSGGRRGWGGWREKGGRWGQGRKYTRLLRLLVYDVRLPTSFEKSWCKFSKPLKHVVGMEFCTSTVGMKIHNDSFLHQVQVDAFI